MAVQQEAAARRALRRLGYKRPIRFTGERPGANGDVQLDYERADGEVMMDPPVVVVRDGEIVLLPWTERIS